MARGLVVASSHTKAASHLVLASIYKASSSSPAFRRSKTNYAAHIHPSFHCPVLSTRLLCSCSGGGRNDPIDMSKYKEAFAKKMAMAGLKPHHRIALGVSGGPDSMALCILAAGWKINGLNSASKESSELIDGLLAIVIDHGLRGESKDEANTVCRRVLDMGIKCKIAACEWSDGKPKQGHLQEAARDMRYQMLQNVCFQNDIGVLLIAHHADDQAELLILRLSRSSGVFGLAGMALTTMLFSKLPNLNGEPSRNHGIILVRPLLEFSKEDMYNICQGGNQEWVEDPTNKSPLYARNRIRMSLRKLSSSIFNSEIQSLISACRRTRLHVDQICHNLINRAVTVMPQGYAVIDLEILNPLEIKELFLSRFLALVSQFVSQRHRPVRGSASKLLVDYIRTIPCKTSLTAAGCYLSPAPGSKGAKVLVCCSVDSSLPLEMALVHKHSCGLSFTVLREIEQIIVNGNSYLDQCVPNAADVDFLDTSYDRILTEAKRLNILSESTFQSIALLQRNETKSFRSKTQVVANFELKEEDEFVNKAVTEALQPGQIGYFMNRFLVTWELKTSFLHGKYSVDDINCGQNLSNVRYPCYCRCSSVSHDIIAKVRHMIDADWLYLAELSKPQSMEISVHRSLLSDAKTDQTTLDIGTCSEFVTLSAQKSLLLLKSIPVAARRGLPVLVNPQGLLLSIPSIGFHHCRNLIVSAEFRPRIALGGGHSSFI